MQKGSGFETAIHANPTPGNTKGGSIIVLLTSCLIGSNKSALQIKTKIVSFFKPYRQLLPASCFPSWSAGDPDPSGWAGSPPDLRRLGFDPRSSTAASAEARARPGRG